MIQKADYGASLRAAFPIVPLRTMARVPCMERPSGSVIHRHILKLNAGASCHMSLALAIEKTDRCRTISGLGNNRKPESGLSAIGFVLSFPFVCMGKRVGNSTAVRSRPLPDTRKGHDGCHP